MSDTTALAQQPEQESPGASFFEQNLAAFREHAPQIYVRLAQVTSPHSRLIYDDEILDIALGDRRFYGEDAVAFTQRQIDEFVAKPQRRYIEGLTFQSMQGIEGRYKYELVEALKTDTDEIAEQRFDKSSHCTVVFGLGLGLHLAPLRDFTGCAELVVVEPNFDNLYHSLTIVDWQALFDNARAIGCAVHLVLEKTQSQISSHLRKLIRLGDPALIDGVYIYQHYNSSLLDEAHAAFHREFSLHLLGLGFFEDELVMMANCIANLKQPDVRVLAAPQHERAEPVFICGSGPSIDADIEVIAAQRDRALVVSMGSVLRTLLANGIRPDFHVETENHPNNAANIERAAAEFGLSGITLLGASTVQPSVTEAFDRALLYFRDRQSPAEVFGTSVELMGSSGPTVANAALVTLLHLGFRELYLFGVDMGSRQADTFHSADTYIGRGEAQEWAGNSRIVVPANFGGDATTETILSWSRHGFEHVLQLHPNVRCVNCSDGVRIAGTVPMLPRLLDLPGTGLDRRAVMADILAKMPEFPLALIGQHWHDTDLAADAGEMLAQFDAILAAAEVDGEAGLDWVYRLYELLEKSSAEAPAVNIFLFGTTCLFLGTFWWFDGRITDEEIRRRFRFTAVRELRTLYSVVQQRMDKLSSDVDRFLAGDIDGIDDKLTF